MQRPKKTKIFKRYQNLSGKSDVLRYQVEKDGVTIEFKNSTAYRYTNQTAGPENIGKMKTLAHAGKGLGTFIETNLKNRFLKKVR